MNSVRLPAVALAMAFLFGCSPAKSTSTSVPAQASDLQDVYDLLHEAAAGNRLPAQVSDLQRRSGNHPRGFQASKSGEVVVLWGTQLQGEGDIGKNEVLIAYDKNVPTEGGYVLLSAGTVKKMS